MTRTHFLAALLALGMAVGCKVQPAPPQPAAPPPQPAVHTPQSAAPPSQPAELTPQSAAPTTQPAALTTQSPAQASPDLSLNRRIEIMVRAQYDVPQEYAIILGERKPGPIPGYDELPVTLSHGSKSQVIDFMISTDAKTLAHLDTYNLAEYPLFKVAGRPIRGNPEAKVTVISFDDLECPYCSMMHRTLFPATLEHYKGLVRFIYLDNPLTEIHPWAMHAAINANCLGAQKSEEYWTYVDYIHAHGQEVNDEGRSLAKSFDTLNRIARQMATLDKLDSSTLDACLARQDEAPVRDAKAGAALLRIEGAPALFVDGVRIGGALPQEQLWMVIDRALRAAGVEPPAAHAQPAPAKPAGTEK